MIRTPLLSVMLLSAAGLAYELLLMCLFSIIHWHHFAYMVIGLALLGHGCSGTVASLFSARLSRRFRVYYFAAITLFAVGSILCFQVAQLIPFNAEEILWDWRQLFYLLFNFLVLAVPFFAIGFAICLALLCCHENLGRIYAADLFGAGIGCTAIIVLLYAVMPQTALSSVAILGVLTIVIAGIELKISLPKLIYS